MYVRSAPFLVVEGLLNFHTETLRTAQDVRVFLAPPEDLRRAWKLKRDCTRRSYTTDEVLRELDRRERDLLLHVPGDIDPAHAAELEEAVWARMSFANHLRVRRLGEFTIGTDLYRSDSLALVQLLVLYHLVWARASVSTGGEPARLDQRLLTGADSARQA